MGTGGGAIGCGFAVISMPLWWNATNAASVGSPAGCFGLGLLQGGTTGLGDLDRDLALAALAALPLALASKAPQAMNEVPLFALSIVEDCFAEATEDCEDSTSS